MAKPRNVTITLPNGWIPRPHQLPAWQYLAGGGKRAVLVWHRRAGKDSLAINWTACETQVHPGVYWHMAPEAKQVRKIVWDGVDGMGRRVIDQAFPKELRESVRDDEMRIRFANGSVWQAVGSDNFDSLVGANPRGIVFSEYSLTDKRAWDYLRPMLAENGGWAIFPYTPRGLSHGYTLYEAARQDKTWFTQLLKAQDTKVFSAEDLEKEKRELCREHGVEMGLAIFSQEYECNFMAPLVGCFFGVEDIEAQDEHIRPPFVRVELEKVGNRVRERVRKEGWLEVWEYPQEDAEYVIGSDVSEGKLTGDQHSGHVLKRGDRVEQVARFAPNVGPDDLGRYSVLAAEWYGARAPVGIERNGLGLAAVIAARDTGYEHLYSMQRKVAQFGEEQAGERLGWETTQTTRPILCSDLAAALRDGSLIIHSEETQRQLRTFIRKANGKPEAADGCKDDDVMGLGIAYQMVLRTEPATLGRRLELNLPATYGGWAG